MRHLLFVLIEPVGRAQAHLARVFRENAGTPKGMLALTLWAPCRLVFCAGYAGLERLSRT